MAVVGYLWDYAALVPAEFLANVTEAVVDQVEMVSRTMEMHDILCCIVLAESKPLPDGPKRVLVEKLQSVIPQCLMKDTDDWGGYGLTPLDVASDPKALTATFVPYGRLQAQLDYLIEAQLPDGSWPLAWSWEAIDASAWHQAERDWKGVQIVNRLKSLVAYGRLEAA